MLFYERQILVRSTKGELMLLTRKDVALIEAEKRKDQG